MLTFEQIIDRANQSSSNARYHIFGEYGDGSRGYFTSRASLEHAKSFSHKISGGIVYDTDGNEVYCAF
jgi:hypothetical protein